MEEEEEEEVHKMPIQDKHGVACLVCSCRACFRMYAFNISILEERAPKAMSYVHPLSPCNTGVGRHA